MNKVSNCTQKKTLGPNEQTASLTNELISNLRSKWPSLTGTETNVDLQNSPQASTSQNISCVQNVILNVLKKLI